MNLKLLLLSALVMHCFYPISSAKSPTYLYAPERNVSSGSFNLKCPFCTEIKAHKDEHYLILHRSPTLIVQLNPYPYAPGHILIYPTQHIASPHELSPITWADMFLCAEHVMKILTLYTGTDKYSIGMNIGTGTIPTHLHLHVVPRNDKEGFLESCCETKLIGYNLKEQYKGLKKYFN